MSTAGNTSVQPNPNEQLWYALRVRSNFERQVSNLLRAKGIEEYLPLYKSRRIWSDRVRQMDLPLIPGYVFCRIPLQSRPVVLATTGVVGLAGHQSQPLPIDERELAAVRRIAETQSSVEPWPFLKIGQRVLVHKGPLAGVEGILLKVKTSYRLVVSVTLLGRAVASEIDSAYAKPI
jgi:transcription antitermination factor NusG